MRGSYPGASAARMGNVSADGYAGRTRGASKVCQQPGLPRTSPPLASETTQVELKSKGSIGFLTSLGVVILLKLSLRVKSPSDGS